MSKYDGHWPSSRIWRVGRDVSNWHWHFFFAQFLSPPPSEINIYTDRQQYFNVFHQLAANICCRPCGTQLMGYRLVFTFLRTHTCYCCTMWDWMIIDTVDQKNASLITCTHLILCWYTKYWKVQLWNQFTKSSTYNLEDDWILLRKTKIYEGGRNLKTALLINSYYN